MCRLAITYYLGQNLWYHAMVKAEKVLSDKLSHFKLTSGLCILVHFISNVRFIIKYAKHFWKGWLNFSLTHDDYNSVKTFI